MSWYNGITPGNERIVYWKVVIFGVLLDFYGEKVYGIALYYDF